MSLFEITQTDKKTSARAGVLHTAHGDIATPCFMPVGTQATVKSLDPQDLEHLGAQIVLSNTYHLHLRPGEDIIAKAGGLHRFMQWNGPILTDSGGFQVFSLGAQKKKKASRATMEAITPQEAAVAPADAKTDDIANDQGALVAIDNDGVTFRSHIDGSKHRFTPESATDIQHKLGADIIMAFDECTPDDANDASAREALARTHAWAKRSFAAHHARTPLHGYPQYLFGIIQGAQHKNLREESARFISSLPFDGIAIGGESVGYNMDATKDILEWVMPLIPQDVPHYAMGVGFSPLDIFEVVERGIDMFDCVSPTRMARNGSLFVHPQTFAQTESKSAPRTLRLNITNARFATDFGPIDPHCACSVCATYSRAYVHHLFDANELLAYRLATLHNLSFLMTLMKNMRAAIAAGSFLSFKQEWTQSF